MKLKLFIPLFILILFSCEKFDEEAVLTEGEKISLELQDISKERGVNKANVSILTYPGSYTTKYDKPFSFSGQFIIVDGDYFNLNNLHSFEIEAQTFDLYFK
jgi:hypothetical protein